MNSTKRKTPPMDVGDSFWDSTCASHREIKSIIASSKKWDKAEIEARKEKIVRFALDRWEAKKAMGTSQDNNQDITKN